MPMQPVISRTIELDVVDMEVHYMECGRGEPLLLLHGNGEDCTYFEHQMSFFQDGYQVIAVDTRGHGSSSRGTAPFTLGQFARDLEAFLEALGIGAASILGFSDGANVALLFALEHSERVKKLVLNGGNLFPEGLTAQTRREIGDEWEEAVSATDERQIELLRLMIDEPRIDPAQLGNLRIPTLVVAGDNDMIEEGHTRLIADSIPGARLAIIEGTHYVAAENPDAFNRVVADFLASTS